MNHVAHLKVSKILTHLCRSRPKITWSDQIEKKNSTVPFNGRSSTACCFFFQNSKIPRPFLQLWRHPHIQFTLITRPAPFPVWEFIMTYDDCRLFCTGVRGHHLTTRGCPRGVMVKAMNCGIVVREFVLQSRYYVHFRANTLGKGMNPLILPPAMGK